MSGSPFKEQRYTRYYRCSFITLLLFSSVFASAEAPTLIDIQKLAPSIVIEMRYATTNNFTKTKLYPVAQCLLCEPSAERLARVQKNLEKEGLGLKVWDCYRPVSVQKKLWDTVPDERFVANPKNGSKHNRGASVDLTLVDKQGRELPMPTEFDEFSEKAHRNFSDLPADILRNRNKLQQAMEAEGFIGLPTEWWHFDDPQWFQYALRDEPLGDPALIADKKSPAAAFTIPADVNQLVLVVSDEWKATTGILKRFERVEDQWREVGTAWPVNVGAKGMTWGRGVHPDPVAVQIKNEGDNTAPAGVFKIGAAYGQDVSSTPFKLPVQKIDNNWVCVDDPASTAYNKVFAVDPNQKKDWKSAEKMNRTDHLYKWVINIEQNYPVIKAGCGSCIFFHVWRRAGSPTEGCTAMSETHIVELLSWLDPLLNPHVVQLPKKVYSDLRRPWKLP
jgi:zinc D-Ala-D-Ala dipeptidase